MNKKLESAATEEAIEAWVSGVGCNEAGTAAKVTVVFEAHPDGHVSVWVQRRGHMRHHEGDASAATLSEAWEEACLSHGRKLEIERRQDALRRSGLSKLTADERVAMGIDGPDASGPWSRINGKACV